MKDFMEQHSLVATNTRFQNPKNRLWTHRRPNGQLVQLDYILVRKKWINSIKNSKAYAPSNVFNQTIASSHVDARSATAKASHQLKIL